MMKKKWLRRGLFPAADTLCVNQLVVYELHCPVSNIVHPLHPQHLIMDSHHPLAKKEAICADDLIGEDLFCSEQSWKNEIAAWAGDRFGQLRLAGSFRLSYNGSMFAREGLGILLTFRNLIFCTKENGLVSRPLIPKATSDLYLIWNRYQPFTPIAERFLEQVKRSFGCLSS